MPQVPGLRRNSHDHEHVSLAVKGRDKLQEVFSSRVIAERVRELGQVINRAYYGQSLVAVCVLKGAFVFFADLVRELDLDVEIDFVRLSSYADKTSSQGRMIFSKDMEVSIENRHVLIVEDIVDTGYSMEYLIKVLQARGPSSVRIASLVDKRERRRTDVQVDFPGFILDKGFIVGYGLDFAEKYRHKSAIYDLTPGHEEGP